MVSALELFESKPASHAADGEEIQHHLQKHLIYWGHTVQTVRTRRQTCIYIYTVYNPSLLARVRFCHIQYSVHQQYLLGKFGSERNCM